MSLHSSQLQGLSKHERKFLMLWDALSNGDIPLIREYKFHPTRKWRFDFALAAVMPRMASYRVAFELHGGVWSRGRSGHSGVGFERDCEKMLEATLAGWTVFQLQEKQLITPTIERLIEYCRERITPP